MIKFKNVSQSYNGRVGCMCGCRGKYSVATHYGVEAANKRVGYEAYETCNDRSVKIAIKKINDAIDWNDPEDVAKHVNDDHAFMQSGDRTSVVFFIKK